MMLFNINIIIALVFLSSSADLIFFVSYCVEVSQMFCYDFAHTYGITL